MMTVTELREFLQEQEKLGRGDNLICVVSSQCEVTDDYTKKFTTEIDAYYDPLDGTITIVD